MDSDGKRRDWLRQIWRCSPRKQRQVVVALTLAAMTSLVLVALLAHRQTEIARAITSDIADAFAAQAATAARSSLHNRDLVELHRVADTTSHLPNVVRVKISFANGKVATVSDTPTNTPPSHRVSVMRPITDRQSRVLGYVSVVVSRSEATTIQTAAIKVAIISLGVTLLLSLLVSWQVVHWANQPLRKLVDAARRLSQGDYDVKVKVTDKTTEVGELQRGFNAATTALSALRHDLQTRVDAATHELADKNAKLEKAGAEKARFFARAAHDLRQPLYALTLFSSTLADGEHDPIRLNHINRIRECATSLDRLCVELLDLSRLETGAMQPAWSTFPLNDLFDELSRNFRMFAEQRNLRLVVRNTNLAVRSDRIMLGRILGNLVSNALRYTREGGVLVGARRRGNQVRIDVWDTGCGIVPKHQKRVFEEFYRVECSHEPRNNQGLGLGLSTVRGLGDLLGTPVTLHSRPGHGSLFTLLVPSAILEAASVATRIAAIPLDVTDLRVLVVDDDITILSAVADLLKSWGCEVRTAEDRQQALEVARQWKQPPGLVISDLRLRNSQSGLKVLAALDRHYGGDGEAQFARLLITGETRPDRLREIVAAQIPVLYKPVTPEQLRESIVAACTAFRTCEVEGA